MSPDTRWFTASGGGIAASTARTYYATVSGIEREDVEARIHEDHIISLNITTRSVHRILNEICEEAEIQPLEGQANYFQPHWTSR